MHRLYFSVCMAFCINWWLKLIECVWMKRLHRVSFNEKRKPNYNAARTQSIILTFRVKLQEWVGFSYWVWWNFQVKISLTKSTSNVHNEIVSYGGVLVCLGLCYCFLYCIESRSEYFCCQTAIALETMTQIE